MIRGPAQYWKNPKLRLILSAVTVLIIAGGAAVLFGRSDSGVRTVNVGGSANRCECTKRLER